MAVYVKEEELRTEIYNIQQSNKLKKLLEDYKNYEDAETLEHIQALKDKGIVPNYSREIFGNMILQIAKKLSMKSNFAGYTWHEDFYSNALEKILTYAINNADLNMISKRSKERTKIFAYISQICTNAFLEIINQRKQEQSDMMEFIIPFEDFYEHVKQNYNPVYEKKVEDKELPDIRLNYTVDEDGNYLVIDGEDIIQLFDTVYSVLKQYREKTDKIEFVYPEYYSISLEELSLIDTLNYKFLNVHRDYTEKWRPSFPRKEFKNKIDKFEEWE